MVKNQTSKEYIEETPIRINSLVTPNEETVEYHIEDFRELTEEEA